MQSELERAYNALNELIEIPVDKISSHIVITIGDATSIYWLHIICEEVNQRTNEVEWAESLFCFWMLKRFRKGVKWHTVLGRWN